MALSIGSAWGCRVLEPIPIAAVRNNVPAHLIAEGEPQIERGKPRPIIDGFGWVWGIPSKLILWNWKSEDHRIGVETEQILGEYLADNGRNDVRLRREAYQVLFPAYGTYVGNAAGLMVRIRRPPT
jgi:hypothetical protein